MKQTNEFTNAHRIAQKGHDVCAVLNTLSTRKKNKALLTLAELLQKHKQDLVSANEKDLRVAEEMGLPKAHINRLVFNESKIESRITSLKKLASLPDPVGQMEKMGIMENGITFGRMRVPLGLILMIYEARPHVTVNAGAFALKSGNAIILKGGSEAKNCLTLLGDLWAQALKDAGMPKDAIQVVTVSHEEVEHLLGRTDLINLVIPRGGKKLIKTITNKSKVPVIKHFEGNCHVYVDKTADKKKAIDVILDSKLLMPGVCNAAESLLVEKTMVEWLPELVKSLRDHDIEVRGCPETRKHVPDVKSATEDDYATEYLDKIYSLKVVENVDEAIAHINKYGSGHTESIITEHYSNAQKFLKSTDSSVVLVNSSTMFCDGESLGMGAEIGISTDKLHARGPMGLEELTSYKFVLWGNGQIMGGDQ